MSETDAFAAFMEARYAEAEARARACQHPSPWKAAEEEHDSWIVTDADGEPVIYDEGTPTLEEAAFIAANDPAHRLADIALKQAILARHASATDPCDAHDAWFRSVLCATARQLGTEFSKHPQYQAEWAP